MNHYGRQALQFSEAHRPNHHRSIVDLTAYFSRLGDEIADEVTRLRDQMLDGGVRPGESLGEFLIRSSQAQAASREIVFSTHHAFVPETLIEDDATTEGDPDLDRYRASLNAIGDVLAAPI